MKLETSISTDFFQVGVYFSEKSLLTSRYDVRFILDNVLSASRCTPWLPVWAPAASSATCSQRRLHCLDIVRIKYDVKNNLNLSILVLYGHLSMCTIIRKLYSTMSPPSNSTWHGTRLLQEKYHCSLDVNVYYFSSDTVLKQNKLKTLHTKVWQDYEAMAFNHIWTHIRFTEV